MFSRKHCILVLLASFGLLLAFGCGDDDNPTGPDTPQNTPAELVGTWNWDYVTENGVQNSSFADYSFTDTSTAQELQLNAGGTWETREYYNGSGPVFTRSGVCYDDDSLYTKCTNDNGTPADGEYQGSDWEVNGSVLTLRSRIILSAVDTINFVAYYTKQ